MRVEGTEHKGTIAMGSAIHTETGEELALYYMKLGNIIDQTMIAQPCLAYVEQPVLTITTSIDKHIVALGEYRHFKGTVYEVVNTALCSRTENVLVIYRRLKDKLHWARPAHMFMDMVERDGVHKQKRFALIEK